MDSTEKHHILKLIYDHLQNMNPIYEGWQFGKPKGLNYYMEISIDDKTYRFRGTNIDPDDNRLPKVDKDIEAIIIETMSLPEDVKDILRDDGDVGC